MKEILPPIAVEPGKIIFPFGDLKELPEFELAEVAQSGEMITDLIQRKFTFLGGQGIFSLYTRYIWEEAGIFGLGENTENPWGPMEFRLVVDAGKIVKINTLATSFYISAFKVRQLQDLEIIRAYCIERALGEKIYYQGLSSRGARQQLREGRVAELVPSAIINHEAKFKHPVIPYELDKITQIELRFLEKKLLPPMVRAFLEDRDR